MADNNLIKDPAPGGPTTTGSTIFTDQWNKIVEILNGSIAEFYALRQPTIAKVAAYTITTDDFLILADGTSTAFTVTLPPAANEGVDGRFFAVKKTDATVNKITVDGNLAETIDGKTSILLETQNEMLVLQSDGVNWHIVGNYLATYEDGTLKVMNPAGTFSYAIKTSAITTNRNATIPLLLADDTFVLVDVIQTIKSKTLADSNGNEILKHIGIASAVNEVTLQNAATLTDPELQATGDDTNVGLKLVPKGTGAIVGNIETMEFYLGDESTPIPDLLVKHTRFLGRAGKIIASYIAATIAPTTGPFDGDILLNGTTIFTATKPRINAASNTESVTGVLTTNPTVLAKNDKLEAKSALLDTGGTAAGVKITLFIYYTA